MALGSGSCVSEEGLERFFEEFLLRGGLDMAAPPDGDRTMEGLEGGSADTHSPQ